MIHAVGALAICAPINTDDNLPRGSIPSVLTLGVAADANLAGGVRGLGRFGGPSGGAVSQGYKLRIFHGGSWKAPLALLRCCEPRSRAAAGCFLGGCPM